MARPHEPDLQDRHLAVRVQPPARPRTTEAAGLDFVPQHQLLYLRQVYALTRFVPRIMSDDYGRLLKQLSLTVAPTS